MANPASDYLSEYKTFFKEFAATMNPDDQLPVKVGGYCLCESEIVGEMVDWILQYLNQKRCPSSLVANLTKTVLTEVRQAIKKQPGAYGFRRDDNAYQPLKLMQMVTSKVNDVCLRYLNPECLESLSPPNVYQPTSSCAVKNSRRRMEDRHTIIEDFHLIFDVKDQGLTNYYAVFDGHAGTDAAMYGVSHLHQFLAESPHYPSNPEQALRDAFLHTDDMFLEKSNRDNLRSGTTALCALLRHKERMLHVAWLGDSQALLVSRGVPLQLVNPHKPDRRDERERIENMGGCVMFWGTWRVNGQLAVSRAIGDLEYKPYVTAEPDIKSIPLDDNQDFLILACDGLWDYVSEQEAVVSVYQTIRQHPGDLEAVSQCLVQLSKQQGSVDNISVIVVFLTDPAQLAAMDVWPTLGDAPVPNDVSFETSNPFAQPSAPPQINGSSDPASYQKTNLVLELAGSGVESYKGMSASSPSETDLYFLNRPSNGKGDSNYEDDDFGPETDVDAVDDVLLSPAIAAAKAAATAAAAVTSSLSPAGDVGLLAFQPGRDETPTPPADEVTSGPALLPEAENVGESGEESEDEWNYYRVDPTEKPAETQPPAVKTAQEEEDEASMESRLNPNAAEFVPSPTSTKPSMEELLSESPRKGGMTMDDVHMPSPLEFQDEVSLRPSGELDLNPFVQSEISGNSLPDLLNGKTELDSNEKNPYQILENESDLGELTEPMNPFKSSDHLFDKSEVSSTKAEFGDETVTSFFANMSDGEGLLNPGNANNSDSLDASMTESDFLAANLSPEMASEKPSKFQTELAPTILSDEQSMFFDPRDVPSVESGIYPDRTETENIEFNSTPLNQELGLGDPVDFGFEYNNLPQDKDPVPLVSEEFNLDFADPLQGSVEVSNAHLLQAECLSNSALSPNKDSFDLVMNFTEEFIAPTSSVPPFSDAQMSSVHSGIENMNLETIATNLSQLETELVSHVTAEPVISELSDFVNYESRTLVSNEAPESLVVENNLLSLLLSQEIALSDESPKEVIDLSDESPKEVIDKPTPEDPTPLTNIDSKEHQEVAKAEGITMESSNIGHVEAVVVAASVAAVATAVAVEAAVSGNEHTDVKGVAKKPVSDKAKSPTAKMGLGTKSAPVPQKTSSKTTPTSPTKPLAPTSRSAATATPKKPAAPPATSRVASKATTTKLTTTSKPAPASTVTSKVTASSTSQVRVKVASSPTKPTPPAKVAQTKSAAPLRPRPTTATTTKAPLIEKKPGLTNGDAKPSTKRPEPLATKRLVPSTATKPLSRPASAPVAGKTITKTTTSSRTTTVSTAPPKPITKPAVNGITKPKTTTTTATMRAKPLSAVSKTGTVDKQVKDTANKQISSVSAKPSTLSRTATSTTTRKSTGGVTKTTTTTTVTKSSSGPIRRPPGTIVTKTSEIITVAPTEVVVVEGFTTTVTKDDSPIIDNAQIEVISSTD